MHKHYRKENNCLNCGTTVNGKFCSECGQENIETKENFWHFLSHNVGHYFHFDSKFFKSIIPLITKPGVLTKEYIEGKRASHFPPASMYLFISVIFFLILFGQKSLVKVNDHGKLLNEQEKEAIIKSTIKESLSNSTLKIDSVLSDSTKNKDNDLYWRGKKGYTAEQYEKDQLKLKEADRDDSFTHFINKRTIELGEKERQEAFWESFKHNIPKTMFLLLPLFAVCLRITFYKSKLYYVEHLVYSLHLHTFIFILLSAFILIGALPLPANAKDFLTFAFIMTLIWYIYRSLRVVYGQGRWKTAFKIMLLYLLYAICFVFSLLLITMILFSTF
ncbi:DUF3667 domain-containing protein [Solitalea canadensis]|uniref:DUF3667 domain-containing protein n=1 Tax=Solitalea canadensis (strain ATCC 29591 / DSM 3403 / JCM 21819 / LMG 8368 / NBRC 15130 / NCIMB 12057 / USAM 9D) TaxID=929556 RepID=H8KQV9_SOLCM|nr:DUF3667 domain-containing protein [Solitalea canadensis]AFD06980.1 Protein of unknown function (DUF3667) [Solitalea canadensis DSM 3403]